MRKIILLLFISFYILSIGCGKKVYVEHMPNKSPVDTKNNFSKVLILPFSSYSLASSPNVWINTNILLYNSIADNFVMHNIFPVPFEDVFYFLKENNFSNISPDLLKEMNNPFWSDAMKKEISNLITEEKIRNRLTKRVNKNFKTFLSMSEKKMFELNQKYNSDYIIRGSITEFKIEKEDTLNPLKIGFFNTPIRVMSRALYGEGESSAWSKRENIFTGVMLGGIAGSFANEPFEPPSHETYSVPLLGTTTTKKTGGHYDYEWGNAAFWGAITGFTAFMASHGGYTPKVIIGLRVYIYDAKNKKMIWTNSIKLHVTPETVWSSHNVDELISFAIKNAVNKLFQVFWDNSIHLTKKIGECSNEKKYHIVNTFFDNIK